METNPLFTTNFVKVPYIIETSKGEQVKIGIPQGEDIVVKVNNSPEPDYYFYGSIYQDGLPISITYDGFNDGAKDDQLIINTKKSVTRLGKTVDIYLPKGAYELIIRDDETPYGIQQGESIVFAIF